MKVKSKVFKRKTGKSKNKWIVRLEYFDNMKGKKSYMESHADRKSDATHLRNKLVDEVKKSHGQIQTGERMNFSDSVAICEKNFYQSAEFAEGRKISGVRSVVTAKAAFNALQRFFWEANAW